MKGKGNGQVKRQRQRQGQGQKQRLRQGHGEGQIQKQRNKALALQKAIAIQKGEAKDHRVEQLDAINGKAGRAGSPCKRRCASRRQAVHAKGNVRVNFQVCPWYGQSIDSSNPRQILHKAIAITSCEQARRAKGNGGVHFNIARPINGNRRLNFVHCHCH